MDRHDNTNPEAYRRLNTQAFTTARPVRDIAECILLSSGVYDEALDSKRPH